MRGAPSRYQQRRRRQARPSRFEALRRLAGRGKLSCSLNPCASSPLVEIDMRIFQRAVCLLKHDVCQEDEED